MAIGYACITLGLKNYNLRKATLKTANDQNLREITFSNLQVLDKAIDYNIQRGIRLFRISSDIIPFGSHSVNTQRWWQDYEGVLENIGNKVKENGLRVSMHPGQYTVINSPDQQVVENAIRDLEYHAKFLDSLGVDQSHKIILHIGGVYGDKKSAIERFSLVYNSLSQQVKNRLVIENDEKSYNLGEVLDIGEQLGIPVVFDNLHNSLNPSNIGLEESELIKLCGRTWKEKDGRQKIHYSQQDAKGRPGAHSSTIYIRPFIQFYNSLIDKDIDIMLEVKDKDISAVKCICATQSYVSRTAIEEEWARYKYLVMEHSLKAYREIRRMFKDQATMDRVEFYLSIEEALEAELDRGNQINAAQHVWGYFKKLAIQGEKDRFIKLIEQYQGGKGSINSIKNYLWKLTTKYEVDYLMESYYFLDM